MDFIKKTICLESARSRTRGLVPYYAFGETYEQHRIVDDDMKPVCYDVASAELESATTSDGNWGQFVANPCFLAEAGKTYNGMMTVYYSLLNAVRDGVKLRKVDTKNGEVIFTEYVGAFYLNGDCFSGGTEPDTLYSYAAYDSHDFYFTVTDGLDGEAVNIYRQEEETPEVDNDFIVLIDGYDEFKKLINFFDSTDKASEVGDDEDHLKWTRLCGIVDHFIGKIDIPAWIFNKHLKAPKTLPCSEIEDYISWLENYPKDSGDCCNVRLWEDMGGDDMLTFLKGQRGTCDGYRNEINSLTYGIPYIEMPILLTQNTTDVGVLTNIDGVDYEGSLSDKERPHGIGAPSGFTIDQIMMGSKNMEFPTTEEYNANPSAYTDEKGFTRKPIEVESLLKTLRSRKKYTDDKDNVLPGLFREFDDPSGAMYRCIKQSEEKFYNLVVKETTSTAGGVTMHTLKYEFQENPSLTKEDIPEHNFLQEMPQVPGETYSVGDDVPNYQTLLSEKRAEMEGKIPTSYPDKDPISVAIAQWRMEPISYSVTAFTNGDGEESEYLHYPESEVNNVNESKKYRTITVPMAGIRIARTEEEENHHDWPFMEHYYFKVKYDNSSGTPMDVPYAEGNSANVYLVEDYGETALYRGDFIIDVKTKTESGVTYFCTKYVIGGYFVGDKDGNYRSYAGSGDVYYEKHVFDASHCDLVPLDGVDDVPVWSLYVDFEADAKEFYSPRYNLYRTGNTANIIQMTTGEIWNKDFAYDAYLTKEDYLINFSIPPRVDVDVTVDRGGASAFERHYKLSECNTLQDVIEYQNNWFLGE